MRDTTTLLTVFLLLAFVGIEPLNAHAAKSCHTGLIAEMFSTTC